MPARITFTLAILLPVVAAATFLAIRSPEPPISNASPAPATATSGMKMPATGNKAASVESLIDGLVARLEQNPGDGKG